MGGDSLEDARRGQSGSLPFTRMATSGRRGLGVDGWEFGRVARSPCSGYTRTLERVVSAALPHWRLPLCGSWESAAIGRASERQ